MPIKLHFRPVISMSYALCYLLSLVYNPNGLTDIIDLGHFD